MQEPRKNVRETIYKKEVPVQCKSWEDSLDAQVTLWDQFAIEHTEQECDSARQDVTVVDGKAVVHMWFEREETDLEYAERILNEERAKEKIKLDAFTKFHRFALDHPHEAKSHIMSLYGPDQVGI